MPEIAERAGEVLGRKVGPLPIGGWAVIGIGAIVVVKLLKGGGSGSGTVTIPDAFADGSSIDGSGSGSGGSGGTIPAVSPPAGDGSPAVAPASYRLSILDKTQFYSTLGKLTSVFGASGTYTATKVKIGNREFWRFKRANLWRLVPVGTKTVRVVQT